MINKLIGIFLVPVLILNMTSGVAAGIWLAILGEWRLIGIGVLLVFTSHWYLSILMMPGMFLGMLTSHLVKKKNPLGYLLGFLNQFYTNLLIVGTCVLACLICTIVYNEEGKLGAIPYLLWSWGMALGPWQFLQSKEPENEFSAITLFSASVFYFLFLVALFLHPIFVLIVAAAFLLLQLLVLPIFSMWIACKMQNADF